MHLVLKVDRPPEQRFACRQQRQPLTLKALHRPVMGFPRTLWMRWARSAIKAARLSTSVGMVDTHGDP
jgi:hypothetical protein